MADGEMTERCKPHELLDYDAETGRLFWRVRARKWFATINACNAWIAHKGERINLGYFDVLEDAVAARKQAEIEYGYHPNHGKVL